MSPSRLRRFLHRSRNSSEPNRTPGHDIESAPSAASPVDPPPLYSDGTENAQSSDFSTSSKPHEDTAVERAIEPSISGFKRDATGLAGYQQQSAETDDEDLHFALAPSASEAEHHSRMQVMHDEELERALAQSLIERRIEPIVSTIGEVQEAIAGAGNNDDPPVLDVNTGNRGSLNFEDEELYNYGPLNEDASSSVARSYPYATWEDTAILSVTAKYTYETLESNEIRVFYMQVSKSMDDEIVGILEPVSIDKADKDGVWEKDKPYTCLSYSWGPTFEDHSHLTDTIDCDGGILRVTSNLKQALRRIRARAFVEHSQRQMTRPGHDVDGTYALWIDAICINQEDLQERSAQVQNMGKIFAMGKSLIIWLGEPDEGKLGEAQCMLLREVCTPAGLNLDAQQIAIQVQRITPSQQSLASTLQSILARTWFKRRWVIQESAPSGVPGYVMLGSANCLREHFTSLLKREHLLHLAKPLQATTTKQSILQTLYTYDECQCEDDRDRVFAVKDLSRHGKLIRVDYNQDVRTTYLNLVRAVVFRDTDEEDFIARFLRGQSNTRFLQLDDGTLMMLALASCKKTDTTQKAGHKMESWYPDWTAQTQFETIEHQRAVEIVFRDIMKPKSLIMVDAMHSLLEDHNGYYYHVAEGFLVDVDAQPSNIQPLADQDAEDCLRMTSWAESVRDHGKSHRAKQAAGLDRIWLPMLSLDANDDDEPRTHDSLKFLAFTLRPSRNRTTYRNRPVYRLQSCFMTGPPPVAPLTPFLDWKQKLASTPRLIWTEFCLE